MGFLSKLFGKQDKIKLEITVKHEVKLETVNVNISGITSGPLTNQESQVSGHASPAVKESRAGAERDLDGINDLLSGGIPKPAVDFGRDQDDQKS